MGMLNKFKKGSVESGCRYEEDGSIRCQSVRHTPDGKETLGEVHFEMNQNCEPVPRDMWEKEEGIIQDLDNRFVKNHKMRCKTKGNSMPEDY